MRVTLRTFPQPESREDVESPLVCRRFFAQFFSQSSVLLVSVISLACVPRLANQIAQFVSQWVFKYCIEGVFPRSLLCNYLVTLVSKERGYNASS